jgi:hypothetical protein
MTSSLFKIMQLTTNNDCYYEDLLDPFGLHDFIGLESNDFFAPKIENQTNLKIENQTSLHSTNEDDWFVDFIANSANLPRECDIACRIDSRSSPHSTSIDEAQVRDITTQNRKAAIERWREKRSRRCFKKKVICKARQVVAGTRNRVGGRFTKSNASGWVAITQISEFDH